MELGIEGPFLIICMCMEGAAGSQDYWIGEWGITESFGPSLGEWSITESFGPLLGGMEHHRKFWVHP